MSPGSGVRWGDGELTVADRWTYRFGHQRHPCIHPLRTPADATLTIDAPADHPWHHGLWFAVKFVDGENFWEELDPYGVQRHCDDPPVTVDEDAGGQVVVSGRLDWVAPDRTTVVLRERRTLTHVPIADGSYAIDVAEELYPERDVVLDRTPWNGLWGGYGGLTLRGRPDWVDTRLLLPDGAIHERLIGVPATGVDLTGTVGGTPVGMAILDHPANGAGPVPWYASTRAATYGDEGWSNFVCAAFLWEGPVEVGAGATLRRQHRVVVHDGPWSADDLRDAIITYTGGSPTASPD
jgi:hypothetical protein